MLRVQSVLRMCGLDHQKLAPWLAYGFQTNPEQVRFLQDWESPDQSLLCYQVDKSYPGLIGGKCSQCQQKLTLTQESVEFAVITTVFTWQWNLWFAGAAACT